MAQFKRICNELRQLKLSPGFFARSSSLKNGLESNHEAQPVQNVNVSVENDHQLAACAPIENIMKPLAAR